MSSFVLNGRENACWHFHAYQMSDAPTQKSHASFAMTPDGGLAVGARTSSTLLPTPPTRRVCA